MARPNYLHAGNSGRRNINIQIQKEGFRKLNEMRVNTSGLISELLALDASNGWAQYEVNSNPPTQCTIDGKCF